MAVNPVVSDPALPPMGWLLVVAGRPGIMVAVVTVIAGLPYVSLAGRWTAALVDRRGRPDTKDDLRKRCRRNQGKSEQQCQCNFFHENRILRGLGSFWMTAQVPDAAEMSVARRDRCALIVTRIHFLCTTPDVLRDVPDCSLQFPRQNDFGVQTKRAGRNPRSLHSCFPVYRQWPSMRTQPSPRCSQRWATQTAPGCGGRTQWPWTQT